MDITVSSSRVRNVVDNILNRYVTLVELRTAIDPALEFVCMSMVSLFREDRLATYISTLNDEIDNLGKSKIDWEFIKSDEFSDLFVKATDNSLKTRFRERIQLNCKILVGSISVENVRQRNFGEDCLILVADLNPVDIMLGLKIYEQQKERPKEFSLDSSKGQTEFDFVIESGWHKLQDACRLDDVRFQTSLHKLSRAGMIKEVVGMYVNYVGGCYIITPTFQSLMNFIRFRANDPLFSISIPDPL
jgi:hypothetical protein